MRPLRGAVKCPPAGPCRASQSKADGAIDLLKAFSGFAVFWEGRIRFRCRHGRPEPLAHRRWQLDSLRAC